MRTIRDVVNFRITSVFEAPYLDGETPPWDIADVEPFSFVALSGDSDEATIGSFFASFLEDILEYGALRCDGGLLFQSDIIDIYPGCCSDLGSVIEWKQFPQTGEVPWAGHDPAPWAELDGESVKIWSDGGLSSSRRGESITVPLNTYSTELEKACYEIICFGMRCKDWLEKQNVPRHDEIAARIISDFDDLK